MNLLPEDKLSWSPVVANNRMNRERNASGINSYEQEFKFKPEVFLEEKIKQNGKAAWLDICCGYGKALVQVAEYFQKRKLQDKIHLKGIDLVDTFRPSDIVDFETIPATSFIAHEKYDLITCVHGLHYIGDKVKVIERSVSALNEQGLFIANVDLNNIVLEGGDIKKIMRELEYNTRTKILRRTGGTIIQFNLHFKGADDTVGPNYTGQEAVTSYYSL